MPDNPAVCTERHKEMIKSHSLNTDKLTGLQYSALIYWKEGAKPVLKVQ